MKIYEGFPEGRKRSMIFIDFVSRRVEYPIQKNRIFADFYKLEELEELGFPMKY